MYTLRFAPKVDLSAGTVGVASPTSHATLVPHKEMSRIAGLSHQPLDRRLGRDLLQLQQRIDFVDRTRLRTCAPDVGPVLIATLPVPGPC